MDDAAQQGIKRKRYEPPLQDLGVKVQGKLHHDFKEVKKAAKKAKVFETQKLIKKLKDLRKKDEKSDEVIEVEGQIESLKSLDHEVIATTALKTKLNKLRILHENEHIQAAISKELAVIIVPATPGTSAAKIQSRLLSSKILAAEVAAVVEDLKNILHPKVEPTYDVAGEETVFERPKKLKKVSSSEAQDAGPSKKLADHKPTKGGGDVRASDPGLDNDELDIAGWESGTVGDDEKEVDDGWESGSVIGSEVFDSAEESDDDGEELGVVPAPTKPPPPKKAPPSKVVLTKTSGLQSTFLPSLSVGFVRGGSDDSDLSESEARIADIDIKKNRRGQRARRAIWEKKFGRGANHKKKELESRNEAPGQGTERRPDTSVKHHPSSRPGFSKGPPQKAFEVKPTPQYRQNADTGWSQRGTSSGVQVPISTVPLRSFAPPAGSGRVEEKPMHPSWEAKRKLKEKESASIVPSQGKKIKF